MVPVPDDTLRSPPRLPVLFAREGEVVQGELRWADGGAVLAWSPQPLDEGAVVEVRPAGGVAAPRARLRLERAAGRDPGRSGHFYAVRAEPGAAGVLAEYRRLADEGADTEATAGRSAATTELPTLVTEEAPPSPRRGSRTPSLLDDWTDSVTVGGGDPPRRGRHFIRHALSRPRPEGGRLGSGARRPVRPAEPPPTHDPDRPPPVAIAEGDPDAVLARLADEAARRRWVRVDVDRVRVTLAGLEAYEPGHRFLVVLQLPDATYQQFEARLARHVEGGSELASGPLEWRVLQALR